jgi:hypothetical protein
MINEPGCVVFAAAEEFDEGDDQRRRLPSSRMRCGLGLAPVGRLSALEQLLGLPLELLLLRVRRLRLVTARDVFRDRNNLLLREGPRIATLVHDEECRRDLLELSPRGGACSRRTRRTFCAASLP